jgi:hypothetical protein
MLIAERYCKARLVWTILLLKGVNTTELPLTKAEERALDATDLAAFPINLPDIRSKVRTILDNWKAGGLFYEYTDHSFQHVLDMLDMCEWIIPFPRRANLQ